MSAWQPVRTFAECDAILTAPGKLHELQQVIIDDRVVKVYKNVEPTLRGFWLKRVDQFREREYLVFEDERLTYGQVHARASDVASTMRDVYSIHKGDRVAIAMRNFPEWIITFWALALLGAVPACVNVWLTDEAFEHCLIKTDCKVAVVDAERAARLVPLLPSIKAQTRLATLIVARAHEGHAPSETADIISWSAVFTGARGTQESWTGEAEGALDDDGVIFFTSGTTSLPKAVLCTRRGFMQNMYSMSFVALRSVLRRGAELPPPGAAANPQRVQLAIAPLFHVAGCTSVLMTNTANGGKLILMRKWNLEHGLHLIETEKITSTGGVPVVTLDLLHSRLPGSSLARQIQQITMGAAPMPPGMPAAVQRGFPNALFMQLYGLTETNLNATGLAGEDQIANPLSCGLPLPICELLVVDPTTQRVVGTDQVGEVWIRGSNIMRSYYNDPEATARAITRDGWFKTGDLGALDQCGMLYIKDRAKDMIIRGGENIHCVTVENALLTHPRVLEAGVVGVPDARLGEIPVAFVRVHDGAEKEGEEEEMITWARKTLPAIAVPVMVLITDRALERNAAGKIVKERLRAAAREAWARRARQGLVGARL